MMERRKLYHDLSFSGLSCPHNLLVLHSSIERRRIVFRLKLVERLFFKCQYVTDATAPVKLKN